MKKLVLAIALLTVAMPVVALADDAGIPAPPPTPGDPPPPEVKPSSTLHDPTTAPVAAWDDAKAARKVGWPALVFALATMLAIAVGTLGKNLKQLAWLNKGRWAVVVGGVAACGAAGYDAAMGGGSLVALGLALWGAFLAYWNSHRASAEPKLEIVK